MEIFFCFFPCNTGDFFKTQIFFFNKPLQFFFAFAYAFLAVCQIFTGRLQCGFFFCQKIKLAFDIFLAVGDLFFVCLKFIALSLGFAFKFFFLFVPLVLDFQHFFALCCSGFFFRFFNYFFCMALCAQHLVVTAPRIKQPAKEERPATDCSS